MQERFNVGGYIDVGRTTPYTFKAHENPRKLTRATENESGNRDAALAAKNYMTRADFATGMMLIDHGNVVFEDYKEQGDKRSEFYSMSIAKSLTRLGIGKALCNGVLKSLDVLAGDIVPETKLNEIGQSTVRQLLMISSGVLLTTRSGQPTFVGGIGFSSRRNKSYSAPSWPLRLGQISVEDYLWGDVRQKFETRHHVKPSQVFVYKTIDTLALGKIIERATGASFASYFDIHVW
jgi:CubicO group peptidase (beta-lactamase class C family)